jgi:hypothetical protein
VFDGDGFIKDMAGNVFDLGLESCIRSDGINIYCVQKEQGSLEKILHKIGKGTTWKNYIAKAGEIAADVYHAHEPQTAFIGMQIQKNTNAKLIYDAHEPWIFSRSVIWFAVMMFFSLGRQSFFRIHSFTEREKIQGS